MCWNRTDQQRKVTYLFFVCACGVFAMNVREQRSYPVPRASQSLPLGRVVGGRTIEGVSPTALGLTRRVQCHLRSTPLSCCIQL